MIEQALIIALIVLSIHYTMQPGEIFGRLGTWFEKHLPSYLHEPVFACNVCMCPHWGSIAYWIIGLVGVWEMKVLEWPIVVITAMGFNVVINKWTPND